jgi:hypothetical protein
VFCCETNGVVDFEMRVHSSVVFYTGVVDFENVGFIAVSLCFILRVCDCFCDLRFSTST